MQNSTVLHKAEEAGIPSGAGRHGCCERKSKSALPAELVCQKFGKEPKERSSFTMKITINEDGSRTVNVDADLSDG